MALMSHVKRIYSVLCVTTVRLQLNAWDFMSLANPTCPLVVPSKSEVQLGEAMLSQWIQLATFGNISGKLRCSIVSCEMGVVLYASSVH